MEIFIEHLLNSAYHHQRQRLAKLHRKEPKTYTSSHIRFGGWEISYNGKGRTRLSKETVGGINFISKAVYLNIIYSHWLVGLSVPYVRGFSDFLDTIAHELARCLLGDFDLDLAGEHNEEQKKLTSSLVPVKSSVRKVKSDPV